MVDDAARAELECIAQTTGGTYADASGVEAEYVKLFVYGVWL